MSSDAAYTPGSWVAVGAESGWLLVDIDPTDPIVLKAWSLLRSGAEVDEILDAVLERGLRAVRSFALVRLSGERPAVVVRGAAEATVTVDGADQSVNPEGVATWREFTLPAKAAAVRLRGGGAGGGAEQPLSPGVTLASSVRLAISDQPLAPRADRPAGAAAAETPGEALPAPSAALNGTGSAPVFSPDPAPAAEPAFPEPEPAAPPDGPPPPPGPAEPPFPPPPAEPVPPFPPPAAPPTAGPPPPAEPPPPPPPVAEPPPVAPGPPAPAIPWLNPPTGEAPPPPPPGPSPEPGPPPPPPPPNAFPDDGPPPPPPAGDGDPDSMAWLSAVKPLGPPSDDSQPYRSGPPTGIVSGGGGIGRDGPPPPPAEPPAGQPAGQPGGPQGWAPPPSDSPDSTISRASLMEQAAAPAGNMVQAVKCQHGHLSPPMAVSCRVCGFPLMGQAPITVPRPTLGVLRLSTGDVVPLDRTVIMGRNPKADETNEAERPHVVRLPSPGHDISRTHVEIRLDGWHVLLTDLNSVNGTVVTPPWQEPQRLRPNEAVPIEPGTVVSLADEVTFRYEVTG
jgi:hypothetical protein